MPASDGGGGNRSTRSNICGGVYAEQQKRMDASWTRCGAAGLKERPEAGVRAAESDASAELSQVKVRAVVGENKEEPMISFYAAAIGVMFLLFTASGSAGALLDEAESGTLERVLSIAGDDDHGCWRESWRTTRCWRLCNWS